MSLRGSSDNPYENEAEGRVYGWDGMGWMGWMDGVSKVSFNFLHTLWVYRFCIFLHIYGIKIVTNILMGFKIWCQVGGGGTQFSKLPYVREFLNIWFQKSWFFWHISVTKRNLWTICRKFCFSLLIFFCFVFYWIQTFLFFLRGFKICFLRRILKRFFFKKDFIKNFEGLK